MFFFDTHCHLNHPSYQADLPEVLQRATHVGVRRILVPGYDLNSSREAVFLAQTNESLYAAVGVHPNEIDSFTDNQMSLFDEMISQPKVIAVGEIGLDLFRRQDNFERQLKVLNLFLELADNRHLPVILHSRNCLPILMEVITSFHSSFADPARGIFHAFEGDSQQAESLTGLGFYIGAGGPITFKNAEKKRELFSKIDLSTIVLETDGPYLAPQEHRGQRNEPAYLPQIAEKVADLQQCDVKYVALKTSENANLLLKWN